MGDRIKVEYLVNNSEWIEYSFPTPMIADIHKEVLENEGRIVRLTKDDKPIYQTKEK